MYQQTVARRTAVAPFLGCPPSSQLGAFPIAAVATAVSVGKSVISSIGGGDDPKRFAAIDRRKAMALQGDEGSLYVLKCWAGLPTPELNKFPDLARDVGINADGSNCGMATSTAKAYARAAYEEVRVRMKLGPALTGGGIATYPGQLRPFLQAGAGVGVGVLLLGGAVIFLLARKRR